MFLSPGLPVCGYNWKCTKGYLLINQWPKHRSSLNRAPQRLGPFIVHEFVRPVKKTTRT